MKIFLLILLCLLLTGCGAGQAQPVPTVQTVPTELTLPTTVPTLPKTVPETSVPTEPPTEGPTEIPTEPLPAVILTEEEQNLLLQLAMAERNDGLGDCPECMALVMRTVLNRVESGRFSKTIKGVIFAPEQFTPVLDGSFHDAVPNELCYEALEMVISGWDESQGCLYYEFCEGESWHSKNLNLLTRHCVTRFYN